MESELFINIENFDGQKFQIIALENDSLNTLKLLIFAQSHITVQGCDFCVNGHPISESSSTLRDLNIQNGDILTIQKRNSMILNIPNNNQSDSNNSSMEISYFSDYDNNESSELPEDLQLSKGFSFAPTLKRQYFCGY